MQPGRFGARRRGRQVDRARHQTEAQETLPAGPWHVEPPKRFDSEIQQRAASIIRYIWTSLGGCHVISRKGCSAGSLDRGGLGILRNGAAAAPARASAGSCL